MQGKKPFLDKEVTRFRLCERVPPHNLYRRLAKLVDWSFLYDETRALYSHTASPRSTRWCSSSSCWWAGWKTW
jgi:hypothetical protein